MSNKCFRNNINLLNLLSILILLHQSRFFIQRNIKKQYYINIFRMAVYIHRLKRKLKLIKCINKNKLKNGFIKFF